MSQNTVHSAMWLPWKIPPVSCFLLGNLFSSISYSQLHNCAKLLFLIFTVFSIFTNFHFLSVFSSPTFSWISEEPESSEVSEAIVILHKTALHTFLNIMRPTYIGKVELCQERKHLGPQKKGRKRRVKIIIRADCQQYLSFPNKGKIFIFSLQRGSSTKHQALFIIEVEALWNVNSKTKQISLCIGSLSSFSALKR